MSEEKNLVKLNGRTRRVDISNPTWSDKVVKIGNTYYLKSDAEVCRIDINFGDSKKLDKPPAYRYFRIKSPLVVKDYRGKFVLKKYCIITASGEIATSSDINVIKTVDDKYELNSSCIKVGGKYYPIGDTRIIRDCTSSGKWIELESAVELSYNKGEGPAYLDRNSLGNYPYFTSQKSKVFTCYHDKKNYLNHDAIEIKINGKTQLIYRLNICYFPDIEVAYSYPDYGRYKLIQKSEDGKEIVTDPISQVPVDRDNFDKFSKAIKDLNKDNNLISEYQEYINKMYPLDEDQPQNTPLILRKQEMRHEGGRILYKNNFPYPIQRSMDLRKTGRIGYTFGVEFETAVGDMPGCSMEYLGLHRMSDGSLRHEQTSGGDYKVYDFQGYEFVTKAFHGSDGVDRLKKICEVLSKTTMISNKCSTHIHVGGMKFPDADSDIPIFNREFSAKALALGALIEDELFDLLPKSRKSNSYCRSIKNWGQDILPVKIPGDKDKSKGHKFQKIEKPYEKNLSEFVFGSGARFSSHNNVNSQLNRWTGGRYYWLNLINCNTDNSGHRSRGNGFKTIEFRAFPATHNFDDVYFYLLFCLSFVWFVENRPIKIIKKEVKLSKMMLTACRNKKVKEFIKNYISKHT